MATRNEQDTTRARANILREFLTRSDKTNRYDNREIYEVMDLCLSCKACKSECPSNVDVAKLKAEFLQHYYDANGAPLRAHLIARFTQLSRLGLIAPALYNFVMSSPSVSRLVKRFAGFAPDRSLPLLHGYSLRSWHQRHRKKTGNRKPFKNGKVYLFCDEFTNFNDTHIGEKAILLLERLGYEVLIPAHEESGRTWLSKGFVRKAKDIANRNIELLSPIITDEAPLIGIEPSAILTFRDEYPDLASDEQLPAAQKLARQALMFDEFFMREVAAGRIRSDQFSADQREILFHGHCQQKSVGDPGATVKMLSLPTGHNVRTIPSGCCGMAGSFGYESEHYDISQRIGALVLYPAVNSASAQTIVAAPGTSCRHQIKDGTGRISSHPVEIMWESSLP
jgi:Fe-S oxidoreductase